MGSYLGIQDIFYLKNQSPKKKHKNENKKRFTSTFLILSLVPLLIIGIIAYRNGKEAIIHNLGSSFQQIAHGVAEKIDRHLYEIYRDVKAWSELELMQEVVTDDTDGKITSSLIRLKKEYTYFTSINVFNTKGIIVASSNPELIGKSILQKGFNKVVKTGKSYLEDVHYDKMTKEWVITFSSPIKAKFGKDRVIGVLCAKWKATELFNMTSLEEIEGAEEYHTHLMLMRNDGLIISAPKWEKDNIFNRNLIKAGLLSAKLASQKKEGYLVEIDEHGRRSLIGYDYSLGYKDFPGFEWFAFVVEDTKIAFASIRHLRNIIFGIGAIVMVSVTVISILMTNRITYPILRISQVASKVARGEFDERLHHISNDEIGMLSRNFNKMISDLGASVEKEKELAAAEARAEVERKRAVELKVAYEKLQEAQDIMIQAEKSNAVMQLASGVAHEVKNPLATILIGINYLRKKLPPNKNIQETLDIMKENIERADSIIRGLVDFSKITKLEMQPQNINTVIEKSLKLVQHKLRLKSIEVIKEMREDLPEVMVDQGKMKQVFVNLFLNALDAMPEGGKLFIRTYLTKMETIRNGVGRRIGDYFRPGEDGLIIEIEDTGTGIPKHIQQKIFDPFFTTKAHSKGTGLGLSVTKNIIDMHKGLITLSSQEGKGTIFKICLKTTKPSLKEFR